MHILWLKSDLLVPLDKGGKLRTWHLMRHLARRHEITYLSFADKSVRTQDLVEMGHVASRIVTVRREEARKGSLKFYTGVARHVIDRLPYAIAKYRSDAYRSTLLKLLDEHPAIRYVPDRRFVVDGGVATTTGISASMPMALTLIEAIAGRTKAEAVARQLGLTQWSARHASAAFQLTRPFARTAMTNKLAFWSHETFGIALSPGIDEVSLALVADAWSRTYRSRAVTFAAAPDAVTTRNGIRILPDRVATQWPAERLLPTVGERPPVAALDEALRAIDARYGAGTGEMVAMQLEYPRN